MKQNTKIGKRLELQNDHTKQIKNIFQTGINLNKSEHVMKID